MADDLDEAQDYPMWVGFGLMIIVLGAAGSVAMTMWLLYEICRMIWWIT